MRSVFHVPSWSNRLEGRLLLWPHRERHASAHLDAVDVATLQTDRLALEMHPEPPVHCPVLGPDDDAGAWLQVEVAEDLAVGGLALVLDRDRVVVWVGELHLAVAELALDRHGENLLDRLLVVVRDAVDSGVEEDRLTLRVKVDVEVRRAVLVLQFGVILRRSLQNHVLCLATHQGVEVVRSTCVDRVEQHVGAVGLDVGGTERLGGRGGGREQRTNDGQHEAGDRGASKHHSNHGNLHGSVLRWEPNCGRAQNALQDSKIKRESEHNSGLDGPFEGSNRIITSFW